MSCQKSLMICVLVLLVPLVLTHPGYEVYQYFAIRVFNPPLSLHPFAFVL